MQIFGLSVTKAAPRNLGSINSRGGWLPIIREAFAGAWQRNIEISAETVLANHAVFACQTLIASDIAKLRVKLVTNEDGIWVEVVNPAYSPVLRKPNAYQTRIQFYESWVLSKLQSGNAYILKERDGRGVVVRMHVLAHARVRPLVSPDGEVFYQLSTDHLAGLGVETIVPAREIIHDRFNCLFHPLVGLSPIYACGLAATQGIAIQNNSTRLFQQGARPGGILTAPGEISKETAERLKAHWDANYTGENAGKVAVLGDGLKFEAMAMNAVDGQVVEQLRWSSEVVCSTYHVPPYKIGIGAMPSYNNVQALNVEYYSQCLQSLIEAIEVCLDEGLATGEQLGTEFDLDGLLRMDALAQVEVAAKKKGIATLDEQRRDLNLKPEPGGDTIYMQQQDHSLAAIAARDAQLINLVNNPPAPIEAPANDNPQAAATNARAIATSVRRALRQKRMADA